MSSTLNRHLAPMLKNVEHITIVRPETIISGNDFHVFAFTQKDFEIFKLELIFPNAGLISGFGNGIAAAANSLLLSGTAVKNAFQINEALDYYGSYVQKSCDYYNASVVLYGNRKFFKESLAILLDAIQGVVFDEKELELYKTRKISSIRVNKQKTSYLASLAFNKNLFGEQHPLGMITDEEDVAALKAEHLRAFYENAYRKLELILCADITEDLKSDLNAILKTTSFLASTEKTFYSEPTVKMADVKTNFIQKDGAVQASMCVGGMLPSRNSPDYLKLVLLNLVLGGYFGSRLMKNIREEKGLTYGIGSGISAYRDFSAFKIRCDFKNEAVDEVLSETKKEIHILQRELIPEEELMLAKNYLIGNFQRSFDGILAQSERFKLLLDLNSDYSYYESYIENIRRINAEALIGVANNYLNPDTFIEIVAGSKTKTD